jgi:hypothetical protein
VYEVRRMHWDAAGRETGYELLGTAGSRRYIDATVPVGAAPITYQITGVRGLKRGEAASFNVVLGVRAPANTHAEAKLAA